MIFKIAETFQTQRFQAMSCPCEILIDRTSPEVAANQLEIAQKEAERVEKKYSRYLKSNIVDEINQSGGKKVKVDEETALLLDFAADCFEISEGLFDITTGALRKGQEASCVGWEKVSWENPFLTMPSGFEIDFGGICKEYASDRILSLLRQNNSLSALVNLGGDIAAAGERLWSVGIENAAQPSRIARTIHLRHGGVATSGTTKRPGHILNPKTGQSVTHAPLSITVAAKTCTEAGFWSTLALLQGSNAESFLEEQHLEYWSCR